MLWSGRYRSTFVRTFTPFCSCSTLICVYVCVYFTVNYSICRLFAWIRIHFSLSNDFGNFSLSIFDALRCFNLIQLLSKLWSGFQLISIFSGLQNYDNKMTGLLFLGNHDHIVQRLSIYSTFEIVFIFWSHFTCRFMALCICSLRCSLPCVRLFLDHFCSTAHSISLSRTHVKQPSTKR